MTTPVFMLRAMYLSILLLCAGCATPGPPYEDVMAKTRPVPAHAIRIVVLRPKDRDDGANGGAARVEVNHAPAGALHYGGFLYVDVASSTTVLAAFGRYRPFGACEIDITAEPGSTVYVDVGPRRSYMIAAAVGGVAGGVAGAAAVPDVYGSAGSAVVTGAAGMAAGSAAGSAVATTAEARRERCRGPYQLVVMSEEDALPHLAGLTWSND